MSHAFRFGVQLSEATSASEWRDNARRVEDLGYSTLYMPDHFVDTSLAPMPAIAIAAAHTTTLRVGALVFDNDYKHPAILAKEMATIDQLTDGRCELGIGAGWMKTDYDALGLPYDSPGVRIARLDEALQVIKGCWADGPFSFSGTHYKIREYDAQPKPAQQPSMPILIGGGGPKVLRLAGREADIIGINPNLRAGAVTTDAAASASKAETVKKLGWIREGAGDRFDAIELQIRYFVCAITDDALGFAAAVAPGFDSTPEEVLGSGAALVGTIPAMIDQLVARRDDWGVSNIVVGGDNYLDFAPVVAALAGT
ncbi:MAG TPA: TIGR03621 family F420-dependent LLM class oxidoreductase [Acidimicrobiia bacterium]